METGKSEEQAAVRYMEEQRRTAGGEHNPGVGQCRGGAEKSLNKVAKGRAECGQRPVV